MFEDGLRYQDARMASEDEMKRDLYGFHINDRVRCTVLLWEIQAP